MDIKEAFSGKRVLITGHTGFKGGWLSIWLNLLGADVIGYALDPIHEDGIFNVSGIGNKMNDIRGDIRDYNKLFNVINDNEPEIVFHLAAQPLVIESYNNPRETFEINTQGTVNLLEMIRNTHSVKVAVIITTDKCYDNKEWIWGYREDEPMGGHDPYSASKGAAELIIASYRKSFFSKPGKASIASARAGNVIGGGDWAENRLVPDIFRAIENNKIIEVRNPTSIRPWQHVLEPLGGYLLLASKMLANSEKYNEAFNFGPYMHEMYTVKNVVESIIQIGNTGRWKDTSDNEKLHEANLLMLDISKANKLLNWRPVLSFSETIELVCEWYLKYKHEDILNLTINQIISYQNKWSLSNEK